MLLIPKKNKLQISRYKQVCVIGCLLLDSKCRPVSPVPLLCISQSFPDRNPLLQWGYILLQWIQAPVNTLGSPARDLTPLPHAAYPPVPRDLDPHPTGRVRRSAATLASWAGLNPHPKQVMEGWM